jgi:hypothetical protein
LRRFFTQYTPSSIAAATSTPAPTPIAMGIVDDEVNEGFGDVPPDVWEVGNVKVVEGDEVVAGEADVKDLEPLAAWPALRLNCGLLSLQQSVLLEVGQQYCVSLQLCRTCHSPRFTAKMISTQNFLSTITN